jgi:hypothetical protein
VGGSTRPAVAGTALGAGAGLLSGALGAYSYYDLLLRPIAHTLGLWLIVVIAVTARRPPRTAILHASTALLSAVIVFYVGKKVMYALRYPGQPYPLNYTELGLWTVLAIGAGLGLGWAFHRIGRPGWSGATATAGAAGLLLGDALRRGFFYRDDIPVAASITVLGLALLAGLTRDRRHQLPRVALLTVPATVVAVLLVSAPDLLEQLVFVGL